MKFGKLVSTFGAAAIGLSAMLATAQVASAEKSFKMASLGAASPTTTFSIAAIEILKKEFGYNIQLSTGSPATRQAVDAAKKDLDLFVTAVSINHFMKNGQKMYAKMDGAKELFSNLRGVLNYPLGPYQGVTWADSGIKSMADLKGKTIFTGPPSGAARTVVRQIIKGSTGYEPKKDYQEVNYDWSSALQAFQDRQVDVYFVPTSVPSPQITQLATIGKIRILGIPDSALDSEGMKAATSVAGRAFFTLPKGQYKNLVNETDVRLLGSIVGLGTTKWMSEEDVYNITKGIFTHSADLAQAAAWMKSITPETGLQQMNTPLHIGAYKYYKEAGIDVPDELIPPEAK
ncbi:MAG: TAXI family TRAP transporter solute-binding subunit [Alphaproteobacteria bacterium]|nr:MAG: TAXI family TRAP transporter solute-binding subunit [Alphaproteobacteria bacterium]